MATLRNRTVIDFHKNPSHTSFKGKSLNRADIEWLLATLDGQGPIDWNVKDQRDRKGLNIYGADLSEVNLRRLPLARLNAGTDYWRIKPFEEQKEVVVTVMKKADLSEAQLQGANFNGVYLQEADLRDTELEKASFFGAQLQSAVLSGSQLEEDNLSYAQLQGASLDGATLEKAVLIFAQLREATISEAHLEKADLSFAQLQSVDLSETHLENVDLRQTVFVIRTR